MAFEYVKTCARLIGLGALLYLNSCSKPDAYAVIINMKDTHRKEKKITKYGVEGKIQVTSVKDTVKFNIEDTLTFQYEDIDKRFIKAINFKMTEEDTLYLFNRFAENGNYKPTFDYINVRKKKSNKKQSFSAW